VTALCVLTVTLASQEVTTRYWHESNDDPHIIVAREHFRVGKRLYEQKEYDAALVSFELSVEIHSTAICYYYYGKTLSDMEKYNEAIQAFSKAMFGFNKRGYYSLKNRGFYDFRQFEYYTNAKRHEYLFVDEYSYDVNNNCKEHYFLYYNLACIYSVQNNIELSIHYLMRAILLGYSHLDFLMSDSGLANIFNVTDWDETKKRITELYDQGFDPKLLTGTTLKEITAIYNNDVEPQPLAHTAYEHWLLNDLEKINFGDKNTVTVQTVATVWPAEYETYLGTYAVKNYTIIITLTGQIEGSPGWLELPFTFAIQMDAMKEGWKKI